VTDSLWKR